jgi:hypothetical protein
MVHAMAEISIHKLGASCQTWRAVPGLACLPMTSPNDLVEEFVETDGRVEVDGHSERKGPRILWGFAITESNLIIICDEHLPRGVPLVDGAITGTQCAACQHWKTTTKYIVLPILMTCRQSQRRRCWWLRASLTWPRGARFEPTRFAVHVGVFAQDILRSIQITARHCCISNHSCWQQYAWRVLRPWLGRRRANDMQQPVGARTDAERRGEAVIPAYSRRRTRGSCGCDRSLRSMRVRAVGDDGGSRVAVARVAAPVEQQLDGRVGRWRLVASERDCCGHKLGSSRNPSGW